MSQPESAVAAAPSSDGVSTLPDESLTDLAARYGLRRAIARPPIGAYLRQVWERRHFIRTYATSRNISRYSSSALGQLWQVLTPLLNAAIYYLVFGLILGQSKDVSNYPAFLITGVFVFTYTQSSIMTGSRAISGNLGLVRALHFPRACLPLAFTLQELQQLAVSMGVLIALVLVTGEPVTLLWLLIPVALFLQTLFNIGASLAMARVGSMVRDTSQLLPFIMRTWLYTSGVFFFIPKKLQGFPEWVRWIMEANPGYVYIEIMRDVLIKSYDQDMVRLNIADPSPRVWIFGVLWAVVALVGGFWYFWRAEERYGRG